MSITDATRKTLWGWAAGKCSICKVDLIQKSSTANNSIIGEEAHIIAQSSNGPRGAVPIEKGRIDHYDNLVLLCRNCHAIVDSQPDDYTVEKLEFIKKDHEQWVRSSTLQTGDEFHYIVHPRHKQLCKEYGRVVHVWEYLPFRIYCCSIGSDPELIDRGIWKASGIAFFRADDSATRIEPILIYESSEAEFDLEYNCNNLALEITRLTYDPRVSKHVPFTTIVFYHNKPIADNHIAIRISPDTGSPDPIINRLKRNKDEFGVDSLAQIETDLYHLRNIGLRIPREIISVLNDLRKSWWCDGAGAEALSSIIMELEFVAKAERFI